jgi:hypothetical protein
VKQDELIRIIASAPAVDFRLAPNDSNQLLGAGVSEDTIKAMASRQSGISAAMPARAAAAPVPRTIPQPVAAPPDSAAIATAGPAEPEFLNTFFRLDDGRLVALERQTGAARTKLTGYIVVRVSMQTTSQFDGGKSPVRFSARPNMDFVVRSPLPSSIDPETVYSLRRLGGNRKHREMIGVSVQATPLGATATTSSEGALGLSFSRYGSSSMKLSTGHLPPGEYAFSAVGGPNVFCFGID